VYDTSEQLDAAAKQYATDKQPIIAGVVVDAVGAADQVQYSFWLNRSLTNHLNDQVTAATATRATKWSVAQGSDPHTFYPSAVNVQYSGQGLLQLQKAVDQYFIQTAAGDNQITLSPFYKSFPYKSWKYDTFVFYFLKSFFPILVGFNLIFTLKVFVAR
jgi:hypothetical protein